MRPSRGLFALLHPRLRGDRVPWLLRPLRFTGRQLTLISMGLYLGALAAAYVYLVTQFPSGMVVHWPQTCSPYVPGGCEVTVTFVYSWNILDNWWATDYFVVFSVALSFGVLIGLLSSARHPRPPS